VGTSTRTQAACASLILCAYWMALPIHVGHSSRGPSLGECLTLADRPPEGPAAIPALERCLALVPNDTEILADLAAQYEAAGRLDDAERACRQGLDIDPQYADLRLRLGRLLLRRGARDEARQQADAALLVQPNRTALVELRREAATPAAVR